MTRPDGLFKTLCKISQRSAEPTRMLAHQLVFSCVPTSQIIPERDEHGRQLGLPARSAGCRRSSSARLFRPFSASLATGDSLRILSPLCLDQALVVGLHRAEGAHLPHGHAIGLNISRLRPIAQWPELPKQDTWVTSWSGVLPSRLEDAQGGLIRDLCPRQTPKADAALATSGRALLGEEDLPEVTVEAQVLERHRRQVQLRLEEVLVHLPLAGPLALLLALLCTRHHHHPRAARCGPDKSCPPGPCMEGAPATQEHCR
mmetsp:Transcript_26302/g.76695  ORF Transcript_26302/g.76695 Transcript_26302/m.76695 type:complete len:259 (+) Transcript_26302:1274-2050(+)